MTEKKVTDLSPCGGMGRGPWPLGRSILGDSGGRPGILLSRPTEIPREKYMRANIAIRHASDRTSGHPLRKDLNHNRICSDITFLEGFSNGQLMYSVVLFTSVRRKRHPLIERRRGSLFIGRKVPFPIAPVGLLLTKEELRSQPTIIDFCAAT